MNIEELTKRIEILEDKLKENKKLFLISYELEVGIDFSYSTKIDNRTEIVELTKEELLEKVKQIKSFTKGKVLDIKII